MQRLLFITLSNIGDLVMTTPALQALHAAWPDARIDVVCDARSSELLTRAPFIGDVHHRVKRDGRAGMIALVRHLRRRRYAAAVDLRTDFLPWLLRADLRSARWQAGVHGPHAVEQHYAVAARVLPPGGEIPATRIWLNADDLAHASAAIADLRGTRHLVLAPGANWPGKIWPAAHYIALANTLGDQIDGVVLLGSAAEAEAGARMQAAIDVPSVNLMGRTSLIEAAATLAQCSLFVGNDSGLGHLAAAVGTRSVTVFGPGRPQRYRPWGSRASIVMAPALDLARLTPDVVAAHVRERWAAA